MLHTLPIVAGLLTLFPNLFIINLCFCIYQEVMSGFILRVGRIYGTICETICQVS